MEWTGKLELTADDLLRYQTLAEDRAALDEAQDFLLAILAAGPKPTKDILKQARETGIAVRTLRRAKSNLGIRSERESIRNRGAGLWAWSLGNSGLPNDWSGISE